MFVILLQRTKITPISLKEIFTKFYLITSIATDSPKHSKDSSQKLKFRLMLGRLLCLIWRTCSANIILGNVEAMDKERACTTNEETTTKKKKKKVIVEIDDNARKKQAEVADKKLKESMKSWGHIFKDINVELETQHKKKKTKNDLVSSTDDAINGLKVDDLAKKNGQEEKEY
ncbi:hypothetical protein R6Q59_023402 [Mikania micrantha]